MVLASGYRRLSSAPWFQQAIGVGVAEYLRLVWNSNRLTLEPPDIYESAKPDRPVILAMWHGQHFLMPFVKPEGERAVTLISHHRDGAVNAAAVKRLGIDVIRGSGAHDQDFVRKGGMSAFREMLKALEDGRTVALTADVPKVARVCGLGIVKLASLSGRPIYPVAIATSRRHELDNWDRSVVPLPFGRSAGVAGRAVWVPRDADAAALDEARRAVEASLNAATARAYAIVDGEPGASDRG